MKFFKATKNFSDPKLQFTDLYKCLGLKTKLVERLGEIPCSMSLPHDENFEISQCLVNNLNKSKIQSIFLEVLKANRVTMQLKTGVYKEYKGPQLILKGKSDSFDDFIIIVEIKDRLGGLSYESQICQILAAAGASLKLKQTTRPVFGVLSDGVTCQFFSIDNNLHVYSSGDHTKLCYSKDLKKILYWVNFIVKSSQ